MTLELDAWGAVAVAPEFVGWCPRSHNGARSAFAAPGPCNLRPTVPLTVLPADRPDHPPDGLTTAVASAQTAHPNCWGPSWATLHRSWTHLANPCRIWHDFSRRGRSWSVVGAKWPQLANTWHSRASPSSWRRRSSTRAAPRLPSQRGKGLPLGFGSTFGFVAGSPSPSVCEPHGAAGRKLLSTKSGCGVPRWRDAGCVPSSLTRHRGAPWHEQDPLATQSVRKRARTLGFLAFWGRCCKLVHSGPLGSCPR